MKKTWYTLTFSLILVLGLSLLGSQVLIPLINSRSYSETNCLSDQITESMDIYDIAKLYRDNQATVAVTLQRDSKTYEFIGSGVCVASNGYETTTLANNIVAHTGSYIATNYHVIEPMIDDSELKVYITSEKGVQYPSKVLWSDANLDLAILYSEENFDYVKMQDRIVNCTEENRLDYEQIFTIGTPREFGYLNRLTMGNVASNNLMVVTTVEEVHPDPVTVIAGIDNVYEDVVDVAIGITGGNSGGGCFDTNGNLLGLTTLSTNYEYTNGNQMNFIVPIYPVMEVLDKVISNKENSTSYSIYSIRDLELIGFDSNEAYYITYYQSYNARKFGYNNFYFEGNYYNNYLYANIFSFNKEGYYVLSTTNSQLQGVSRGDIISKVTINGEKQIEISNRNDLIYALLQVDDGNQITISFSSGDKTLQF